ncbi:MAG: acetyl-CoA decarbonylase/synthase complex subunit gamma [Candidatus Omnitrophica bacterium]|nr:acetyl-CoA decarbonylase/synthase complex subunit gamma [Candidatus Omnitrophota bacterium]
MALSGLDIYKLLPKTNCRECGFPTCLAFAMQLAKKAAAVDKCPYVTEEAKAALESAGRPPVRLVSIGSGERKLDIGNETVMFRHEEKFRNPCGIGFIIDDGMADPEIKKTLRRIHELTFERVGQKLSVDLIAIRQNSDKKRFCDVVKMVSGNTACGLVLMTGDKEALQDALELTKGRKPLVYRLTAENVSSLVETVKRYRVPVVAASVTLDGLSVLTAELDKQGITEIVLDTGMKPLVEKIWDMTQIRRLALKKSARSLGYPALAVIDKTDRFEECMEAATYILKYGGIVLLKGTEIWQALSLLTLRQNIYSDPQKPLQIEPKIYPVGAVTDSSPALVTTNFSLSYYTVLSEVEASKVPAYILSVDTEGMSVLTAWAAEKFTPAQISASMKKSGLENMVAHRNLIIPGYVAVISGELEDASGWKITVGPKEASGIPSFLKNLYNKPEFVNS